MEENIKTVVLGIPSGIFATFFIWLFFVIYKKQIMPWFQGLVYRGVEIKGVWQNDLEQSKAPGDDPVITSTLNIVNQQGHSITGVFSQQYTTATDSRYGSYIASGQIIDGVVVLTLMPESRNKSTYGTLVLNLGSASLSLEGVFTYKGAVSNGVTNQNVKLLRKL